MLQSPGINTSIAALRLRKGFDGCKRPAFETVRLLEYLLPSFRQRQPFLLQAVACAKFLRMQMFQPGPLLLVEPQTKQISSLKVGLGSTDWVQQEHMMTNSCAAQQGCPQLPTSCLICAFS